MNNKVLIIIVILISIPSLGFAENGFDRVDQLRTHVEYLASDELQGRRPCSRGDTLAREYIANYFIDVGLLPIMDDEYVQYFPLVKSIQADSVAEFGVINEDGQKESYQYGKDFAENFRSGSGKASGEGLFIGYGIHSPENDYNDFNKIDMNGRIVFSFLSPSRDASDAIRKMAYATRYYKKIELAASRNASAFVFISSPRDSLFTGLNERFENKIKRPSFYQMDIPVIKLKYSVFKDILNDCKLNVDDVEKNLKSSKNSYAFILPGCLFTISCDVKYKYCKTCNVIGFRGKKNYKKPTIVIGAHYDHLGIDRKGYLARGANDNASGVAVMMELASLLSGNNTGCNYLFVAFGMEEWVNVGSEYFMENIPDNIGEIKGMINLDMVGGLKKDTLMVWHSQSAREWPSYLEEANTIGLNLDLLPYKSSPSDSDVFCKAGIPTLFLYTGPDHFDSDKEIELLNYTGMNKILYFSYNLIKKISSPDNKLTYRSSE